MSQFGSRSLCENSLNAKMSLDFYLASNGGLGRRSDQSAPWRSCGASGDSASGPGAVPLRVGQYPKPEKTESVVPSNSNTFRT